MDLHQHSPSDLEGPDSLKATNPELHQKLVESYREMVAMDKAKRERANLPPAPARFQVHGEHQAHLTRKIRENRWQCLDCQVDFRFRASAIVKRRRLLRR